MTYALVREDVRVPVPTLQPVDEVAGFLSEHVEKLLQVEARLDAPPPGVFVDSGRQGDFHHLHAGTDDEFLAAYRRLAQELVNVMSKATKDGLLVGLRAVTEGYGTVAGVLKLEIVAPQGAALLTEADGSVVRLEAIKDMVDAPGKLQKGALVTSRLPPNRVHCRDTSNTYAKYFPAALGVKVHPRPQAAMAALLDVTAQVIPQASAQIEDAVPTCAPGPVRDVLAEVANKVPELTEPLQVEIAERLSALAEPVTELDPGRTVKGTYKIGGILVTGPLVELGEVTAVQALSNGQWQLTITGDAKPEFFRT
jgi:hypothetical protein